MNGELEGHTLNTQEWVPIWEGVLDQGWVMKGEETKQNKEEKGLAWTNDGVVCQELRSMVYSILCT